MKVSRKQSTDIIVDEQLGEVNGTFKVPRGYKRPVSGTLMIIQFYQSAFIEVVKR
jgi:hypothetical protein